MRSSFQISLFGTAEVVSLVGATPVFCDVEEKTYNLNPGLIEEKIISKTKAIMFVSLYGQCPNIDLINDLAEKLNLSVIEDELKVLEQHIRAKNRAQ